MDKPKVFVSHITEEAELAEVLTRRLGADFLGLIDFFVSSDDKSIPVGSRWLNRLSSALDDAKVMLILCSERSVGRPWINFEAGAGWLKGIPIVPVCHTGMQPSALPKPLDMLQGIQASQTEGLRRLYGLLSAQLGSAVPPGADLAALAQEVAVLEHRYGLVRAVREAIRGFLKVVPEARPVFLPSPPNNNLIVERIYDWQLREVRPSLDMLQARGMLAYSLNAPNFAIGTGGGGVYHKLTMTLSDAYYQIAQDVMA